MLLLVAPPLCCCADLERDNIAKVICRSISKLDGLTNNVEVVTKSVFICSRTRWGQFKYSWEWFRLGKGRKHECVQLQRQ